MSIPACILTLIVAYPPLVVAGYLFYRYAHKKNPQPYQPEDLRNRYIKKMRFTLYVLLLPLGTLLSMAVLGWLDPLFYWIASLV